MSLFSSQNKERHGPGSPSSPVKTPTSVSSKPEKSTASRPPSTTPSNKSTKSRSTSRNRLVLKTPEPEPNKKGTFEFYNFRIFSVFFQNSKFKRFQASQDGLRIFLKLQGKFRSLAAFKAPKMVARFISVRIKRKWNCLHEEKERRKFKCNNFQLCPWITLKNKN